MVSNYITDGAPGGRHRRRDRGDCATYEHAAHRLGPRPRRHPLRGDRLRRRPTSTCSASRRALGVLPSARRPADDDAVVISHALWQQRFGGAVDVIGKPLRLGQRTHTIVAVAPRGFAGIDDDPVDVWAPLAAAGQRQELEDDRGLLLPARASHGCGPASIAGAPKRTPARSSTPSTRHQTDGRHAYQLPDRPRRAARRGRSRCGSHADHRAHGRRRGVGAGAAHGLRQRGQPADPQRTPPLAELALKAALGADARSPAARGVRCKAILLALLARCRRTRPWCSPSAASCDGCCLPPLAGDRRPDRRAPRTPHGRHLRGPPRCVLGLVPAIRLSATRVTAPGPGALAARRHRGSSTRSSGCRSHCRCRSSSARCSSPSASGRSLHVDFGQ